MPRDASAVVDGDASEWVQRTVKSSSHSAAGCTFAMTIVVFALGGWALDRWLGTSPWLLLAALVLGFVGALISLVKRVPISRSRSPR